MKKADFVSAAAVTAFGLLLLFVVIPIWVEGHEQGGYGLDARVLPNTMAVIITALGVMLFASRFFERRQPIPAGPADDTAPPISRSNWIYLLSASLFLIAMTASFAWVGFIVTGPLTIAGFMLSMGERRPLPIVLTAILAPGMIWLFFWRLLGVPLP